MDNVCPKKWGHSGWVFLHYITIAYRPTFEAKRAYKAFFESLTDILPCNMCRRNYKRHLENHPLDDDVLNDKESLIRWLMDIHNEVNRETNKPIFTIADFNSKYRPSNSRYTVSLSSSCMLIVILVVVYIYWRS